MGWIFRKSYRSGPFRTTVSRRGVGTSWGLSIFRFGVTADGRHYLRITLPGTGLYWIKYFS